jgi:anaerobic magnesium-protoporphyrin IX monomethyl ester cyclase
LKTVLISDTGALGMMEVRPEPAWRVKLTGLRNKDLLAPDYGAMHVVASLKAAGHPVQVINAVADVHHKAELFHEPNTDPDELSGSIISGSEAPAASRKHLFDALERSGPDVILVTLSIYNLALYTRKLLAEIREACPGAVLVTGGIYATMHPGEILADGHADVVVRGEGEQTCAELLEGISNGEGPGSVAGVSYRKDGAVVHNPDQPPVADLDSLPHPYTVSEEFKIGERFEALSRLLPHGDWIPGAGFLTSRGCPEACSFCLDPAINGRRTRFHSPAYVREVLDYCSENFQAEANSFFFGDATFTMNRKRLQKILGLLDGLPYSYQIQTRADYLDDRVISSLASRGFTHVAIGAESLNEKILQEVALKRLETETILQAARGVRLAGMQPILTFIVGLPGETRDSIWRTVEILKENGLYSSTFFPLVVFKGTALFEQFTARVSPEEMEAQRLNPASEEFLFSSEEFPTPEELTEFTAQVNSALFDARTADG